MPVEVQTMPALQAHLEPSPQRYYLHTKNIQMANKDMEKVLNIISHSGNIIKTTICYIYTNTRMANIKKTTQGLPWWSSDLRLRASNAEGVGSIRVRGTRKDYEGGDCRVSKTLIHCWKQDTSLQLFCKTSGSICQSQAYA